MKTTEEEFKELNIALEDFKTVAIRNSKYLVKTISILNKVFLKVKTGV